jgi:prolyl oligopeptidase
MTRTEGGATVKGLFCFKEKALMIKSKTDEVVEFIHGVEVKDPYRWLEDQNSPETREWLQEQKRYFRSVISGIPGRETISKRLEELLKVDFTDIPLIAADRYFYLKKNKDQEQFVICSQNKETGEEKILADPHPLSEDYSISFDIFDVAGDGKTLAYSVRDGGEDEVSINVIDTDTGNIIDSLPKAKYCGVVLRQDKKGLYYSVRTENGGVIKFHVSGSSVSDDEIIFGGNLEKDKFVHCSSSEDGKYIIILVYFSSKTEIFYKDVENNGPVTALIRDIDAESMGTGVGDTFYFFTNYNAPNGKIVKIDLNNPEVENWIDIVPESSTVITYFQLSGGKLFVNCIENASSVIKLYNIDGTYIKNIPLPASGTASSLSGEWKGNELFCMFSSSHIPSTVYKYDLNNDSLEIWGGEKIPFDSDKYVLKQVWYKSKDGTEIPMHICHLKNLTPDVSTPALLTGYGGFGMTRLPSFGTKFAVWIENGGVLAMPALRGGGEFGRKWHQSGMLEKKQNVFDDFIEAAEWLVKNNYTSPDKLAIFGRSNGGLLTGAVMVQRPDLFRVVSCGYPLLDMIRYHKFLCGFYWVSEYGSPDNPEHFEYLIKYSPYHNVRQGVKYPSVIFITGDSDTRVDPLHARKMAALLQENAGDDNPVVLMYDEKAGHITAEPVSERVETITDELIFLMHQTR